MAKINKVGAGGKASQAMNSKEKGKSKSKGQKGGGNSGAMGGIEFKLSGKSGGGSSGGGNAGGGGGGGEPPGLQGEIDEEEVLAMIMQKAQPKGGKG